MRKHEEKWEYKIDGRRGGIAGMVVFFAIWVFLLVLAVGQVQNPGGGWIVPLIFVLASIPPFCMFIKILIRFFCFKVCIGNSGFYFQSTPFNGKFYPYRSIRGCMVNKQTSANHSNQITVYYFVFTDNNGVCRKFPFEKSIYQREIQVLQQRIQEPAASSSLDPSTGSKE